MTIYYSNLYELAPNRGTATYIPRFPAVDHRAMPITELVNFNISGVTLGIGDQIRLIPGLPAGCRVSRFAITNGAYDSSTTLVFNIGWLSQASGAGILTAQSFLRAAGTTSLTDAQIIAGTACGGAVNATTNLQAAGAWDELLFTVTTAATGAGAGTVSNILCEIIFP